MSSYYVVVAYILLCAASLSFATEEVNFTGKISSRGSFRDPTGLFAQGDPLSGFWIVDTSVQDVDPEPSRGSYPQTGAPAFRIDIGSWTFQTSRINIQILNDATIGIGTIDSYDVLSGGTGVAPTSNVPQLSVQQMQWTIRDTVAPLDAVSSDELFAVPDISRFDQVGQVQGQITGRVDGELFFMNLELDAVAAGQIPPPATPPPTRRLTSAPTSRPSPAPSGFPSLAPTQAPSGRPSPVPSRRPTPAPTQLKTAVPTKSGYLVNETIPTLLLVFRRVARLDDSDLGRFETITEEWFEGFFSTPDWQEQVRELKTRIRVNDQNVTLEQGDVVNAISYKQSLHYVALDEAFRPIDYALAPFLSGVATKAYANVLASEIEAFKRVQTPLAPPKTISNGGELDDKNDTDTTAVADENVIADADKTSTALGLVAGVVSGVVVLLVLVAVYFGRRPKGGERRRQARDPTGVSPSEPVNELDPETAIGQVAAVSDAVNVVDAAGPLPLILGGVTRVTTDDGRCTDRPHFKDQTRSVACPQEVHLAEAHAFQNGKDPLTDDEAGDVTPRNLPQADAINGASG